MIRYFTAVFTGAGILLGPEKPYRQPGIASSLCRSTVSSKLLSTSSFVHSGAAVSIVVAASHTAANYIV